MDDNKSKYDLSSSLVTGVLNEEEFEIMKEENFLLISFCNRTFSFDCKSHIWEGTRLSDGKQVHFPQKGQLHNAPKQVHHILEDVFGEYWWYELAKWLGLRPGWD